MHFYHFSSRNLCSHSENSIEITDLIADFSLIYDGTGFPIWVSAIKDLLA